MGESADFIDYTLLQKKGTLQRARRIGQTAGQTTSVSSSSSNPLASFFPTAGSSEPVNPFGMLDNAASSTPSSTSTNDISAFAIKLDDVNYKLERLVERLALLEGKFDVLGKP